MSVLDEAVMVLDEARVQHALIGGIASSILGRPRATGDIDVFLKPADAEPALVALNASGFSAERTDPKWLYKATKHGVQVDVIFSTRVGIYFDDEMFARSRVGSYLGSQVRVVSPEDLLIIKAVAHDEATPRHWFDALGILLRSDLDWEYLIHRVRRGQRRVLSLLFYAQSIDYYVPERVLRTLAQRAWES